MRKMISVALLTGCIAIFGVGCGSNPQTPPVEESTSQVSQEEAKEDSNHIHEWTYMENNTQSWEECEACGAKKNIVEITTEAPATTEATTEKKKETKKKAQKREDYKTDHDYDWYMRNATGGEKFSYTMQVIQTVEDGSVYLCDLGTSYSGNMVFVYIDTENYTKEIKGGKRIIEDDIIRVYGTFKNTYIYETANGGSKESLVVEAAYVDIQ